MFESRWTKEQIRRLLDLQKTKHTYKQIAEIMQVTKSAIAGAIKRYSDMPKQKREVKPRPKAVPKDPKISFVFKTQPLPNERIINNSPVSFPQIGGCKSIHGDPKALLCCGLPVVSGSSWCAEHHRLYHQKIK